MNLVDSTPLISIVVPTRNRHYYLAHLVRTILAMKSPEIELVVHDNSPDPKAFKREFEGVGDSRLRYFHDATPMSITENFSRSVALARGRYICMIGDDDGVTESIVDLAAWLEREGIDAAAVNVATYLWPGVESALDGAQREGVLRLPAYSGVTEVVDSAEALDRVLVSGGIRIGDLPSVYQGIVARKAMERLRDRAGSCFPGPSPDMANAVGLSAVVDRFARVAFPVVISGSCPVSGAAQGARREHHGEIADQAFLPHGTAESWPAQVPFYFSGPTLWAATLIHALTATNRADLISRLRFDRLYGACAVFAPAYRSRLDQARARNPGLVRGRSFIAAVVWVWWLRVQALSGNMARRLGSAPRGLGRVEGLANIGDVVGHVDDVFGRYRPPTGAQGSGARI
ncbi:MAG: glycosyltransferase [Steroidobacteraceae bacterium]